MLSFDTTITKASAIYEGVRFTVRVLSDIERPKRDLAILDDIVLVTELSQKCEECLIETAGADVTVDGVATKASPVRVVDPARKAEHLRARLQIDAAVARARAAKIRYSFVSIEGIEADGKPATIDQILSSGKQDLIEEIEAACTEAEGLSAAQRKNLPSPGTSPEPAEEAKAPTIA